jgi:hypothetical protein
MATSKEDFEDILKVIWAYKTVTTEPESGRYAYELREYNIPDPDQTMTDVFEVIAEKLAVAEQEFVKKKAALDKWEAHLRILKSEPPE